MEIKKRKAFLGKISFYELSMVSELLNKIQALVNSVPEPDRNEITVTADDDDKAIEFWYWRPETEEETYQRQRMENHQRLMQEQRDREEFARLKAKYGEPK